MSYFEKTGIYAVDSPSIDAFGRWRVSEVFTLFDSKLLYNSASYDWSTKTVGNATASYQISQSSMLLTVSSVSGSRVIRQTKRYMPYQPGKSQVCICTGNLDGKTNGIIKRVGYFDDNNGLFFEMSGSSVGVVKRSNTSTTPVNTFVSQSDWNKDRMDGTGPSKINVDFSKAQIYFVDFEWLGVGRVRYGMFVGGSAYYVHEFGHANELQGVYMSNPNLPIRYEILNATGTATTGSLFQICSTILSEAGYEAFNGRERSVDGGGINTVRIDSSTYGMTIGLRQQIGCPAATIIPTYLSVVTPAGPDKQWSLLLNPTLATPITGSSNWYPINESNMEYITGSTGTGTMNAILNEGIKLASGWFSTTNDMISVQLNPFVTLGRDLDENRDILVLAVRTAGAASDGYVSLGFKEII